MYRQLSVFSIHIPFHDLHQSKTADCTVSPSEDGHAEALEFYIKEDSAVTNVPLNRLHIRKNILVCSIVRGGQAIIPSGQDELHVGDYVVVVLTHARLNDIKDIIEG